MKLIKGIIINPFEDFSVKLWQSGALAIEKGKIAECGNFKDLSNKFPNAEILDFQNSVIIPGLIDMHTHLPQFTAMGLGNGELISWLESYIFPLESKFTDEKFAREQSEIFFDRLLRRGTTSAVIYSAPHKLACDIAFEVAKEKKIRAFIGKTMMDKNSPKGLIATAEQNIADSIELAKKWHNDGKMQYVLTPRFAIACSAELMKMTAEVAALDGLFVQTHLSENLNEIAQVKKLFPDFSSYTEVYDKLGILTERTLLAHCVHLSDNEIEIIKRRDSIAVHCPASNKFLSSGIMPAKKYLKENVNLAIGSDVAGGYSQSLLNEAMEAVECSKLYSVLIEKQPILSPRESLCLATIKAAEHLKISDTVGNFASGKSADIAVFDLPDYLQADLLSEDEIISSIIYNIDNRIAKAVFIDGELYKSNNTRGYDEKL